MVTGLVSLFPGIKNDEIRVIRGYLKLSEGSLG